MIRKAFAHYIVWFCGVTFLFVLQLVLRLDESGFTQPIQTSMYWEYLVLNLAWIVSLSLPLTGLLGSSSTYISELRRRTPLQQGQHKGGVAFSRLAAFLTPAIALGTCIALLSLLTCLFVVPHANSRIASLLHTMRADATVSGSPKSDREMTVGELLEQAGQLAVRSNQAEGQQLSEIGMRRNQLMVEVHKKFAIPLLGFILPVLGSLIAIVLSNRRSGRRIILFLFDLVVLILVWFLLIAGETWGDRGILPPFVAMFLTPGIAAIIAAALLKRSSELLVGRETAAARQ